MSSKVGQVYFDREKHPLYMDTGFPGETEYSESLLYYLSCLFETSIIKIKRIAINIIPINQAKPIISDRGRRT